MKATKTMLGQMALKVTMRNDHTLFIFADTPENIKKYANLKSWL
jgi:hypothetical protein